MCTWSYLLHDDVKELIFLLLTPRALLTCRCVCKQWKEYLENADKRFWRLALTNAVNFYFGDADIETRSSVLVRALKLQRTYMSWAILPMIPTLLPPVHMRSHVFWRSEMGIRLFRANLYEIRQSCLHTYQEQLEKTLLSTRVRTKNIRQRQQRQQQYNRHRYTPKKQKVIRRRRQKHYHHHHHHHIHQPRKT